MSLWLTDSCWKFNLSHLSLVAVATGYMKPDDTDKTCKYLCCGPCSVGEHQSRWQLCKADQASEVVLHISYLHQSRYLTGEAHHDRFTGAREFRAD